MADVARKGRKWQRFLFSLSENVPSGLEELQGPFKDQELPCSMNVRHINWKPTASGGQKQLQSMQRLMNSCGSCSVKMVPVLHGRINPRFHLALPQRNTSTPHLIEFIPGKLPSKSDQATRLFFYALAYHTMET